MHWDAILREVQLVLLLVQNCLTDLSNLTNTCCCMWPPLGMCFIWYAFVLALLPVTKFYIESMNIGI